MERCAAVSSVVSQVVPAPAAVTSTASQFASLATVALLHVVTRFYVRYGDINSTSDSRFREISV